MITPQPMRKLMLLAGLVMALVVSGLAIAAANGDPPGHGQSESRTITLTATGVADKDFDLRPRDLSLGDYFVATENLFRQRERVGSDHGICTITRLTPRTGTPEKATLQCVATFLLPEGQITVQGVRIAVLDQQQPPRFELAVTGGTGAYKTAQGSIRIVDINATDSQLTIHLIN